MRLFDRFRRPRVNGSTPTPPEPVVPLSEEELKQKAAQASFIVVEFAGTGQRRIWDWENEIIERAKRSKIAVPGRTH